jgi:hypothetical protein
MGVRGWFCVGDDSDVDKGGLKYVRAEREENVYDHSRKNII